MTDPQKPHFPPVRACLFDMDGLLINSEDIYTLVINLILREHGKPDLPWSIKAQLQGRPAPQASKIFHTWAQLPLDTATFLAKQSALHTQHFPACAPLPGVIDLLANLTTAAITTNPNSTSDTTTTSTSSSKSLPIHIALATSSHSRNFSLKTSHLHAPLFSRFPPSRVVLGDDPRVRPGRGKPLPDIYLLALETINREIRQKNNNNNNNNNNSNTAGFEPEITPAECLVFEDSVPGVEAGRRAGMRVVWVPHAGLRREYEGREEEVLAGLTGEVSPEPAGDGNGNGDGDGDGDGEAGGGGGGEAEAENGSSGRPGELGDGWAEILASLEEFEYGKYGIQVAGSRAARAAN